MGRAEKSCMCSEVTQRRWPVILTAASVVYCIVILGMLLTFNTTLILGDLE